MTVINFDIDGRAMMLEVTGHATGSPEACAGISAIVEALSTYISVSAHVSRVCEHKVDDGNCIFRVSGDSALAEVWRMACIGLKQIALAYPGQVSMEWEK